MLVAIVSGGASGRVSSKFPFLGRAHIGVWFSHNAVYRSPAYIIFPFKKYNNTIRDSMVLFFPIRYDTMRYDAIRYYIILLTLLRYFEMLFYTLSCHIIQRCWAYGTISYPTSTSHTTILLCHTAIPPYPIHPRTDLSYESVWPSSHPATPVILSAHFTLS